MELTLESRVQLDETVHLGHFALTPALGKNYWTFRVKLSSTQAIVGFPKFGTIGIGFAVEDADYNTNLPYTCGAQQIYDHIQDNKGDDSITELSCPEAIAMVQAAAKALKASESS